MLAAATTGDEVVRYSLLGEGKRLRPTLVFAAHDALNGSAAAGVADLAAAVEVVHAYSLVHDDLPCMDNDDLRRGRPTAHRAFDVPRATRAGYDMVTLAARVLAQGLAALRLPPPRRREISLELFRAAGAGGMIGGQALDLEAEAKALPIDALEEVHARKTGALIAASCVIGGLSVGEDRRRRARRYGDLRPARQDGREGRGARQSDVCDGVGGRRGTSRSGAAGGQGGRPPAGCRVSFSHTGRARPLHRDEV